MTDIYLCRPGDSLDSICRDILLSDAANSRNDRFESYRNKVEGMNPQLDSNQQGQTKLKSGDLVALPGGSVSDRAYHAQTVALPPAARQTLSEVSDHIGGSATLALACVIDKVSGHLADLNTFGGGGLGAVATRGSQFLQALDQYDLAIQQFHSLRNHRAAPATLQKAQTAINKAYLFLQTKFNRELQGVMDTYVSKTKTSILHRGAGKSRTIYRTIPVRSASYAKSLANFGRYSKILGPAAITTDGYFRYDSVMDIYNTGGNWKRELYAQSIGFTAGIVLGIISFSFLLGPLGWVLGILIAGTTAVLVDHAAVGFTKSLYDGIQRW